MMMMMMMMMISISSFVCDRRERTEGWSEHGGDSFHFTYIAISVRNTFTTQSIYSISYHLALSINYSL